MFSTAPHFLLFFRECVQKYAHVWKVNLECCSLGDVTLVLRASLDETWDSRLRLGWLALEASVSSCLYFSSPRIASTPRHCACYVSSGDQTESLPSVRQALHQLSHPLSSCLPPLFSPETPVTKGRVVFIWESPKS